MDAGVGNVGAELVQDILELGLVLLQEVLLGSGEGGQSRDEGGSGEAHGCYEEKGNVFVGRRSMSGKWWCARYQRELSYR